LRIALVGGPKTGKTTLAKLIAHPNTYHTDELKHLPWHSQATAWLEELSNVDSFLVEGVTVARMLRKGLEVDVVVYLQEAKVQRTAKQEALAKGVDTVYKGLSVTVPQILEQELLHLDTPQDIFKEIYERLVELNKKLDSLTPKLEGVHNEQEDTRQPKV